MQKGDNHDIKALREDKIYPKSICRVWLSSESHGWDAVQNFDWIRNLVALQKLFKINIETYRDLKFPMKHVHSVRRPWERDGFEYDYRKSALGDKWMSVGEPGVYSSDNSYWTLKGSKSSEI